MMAADLGTVEDQKFVISKFRLQNGAVMQDAKIAYETYGRLAADRRNAVLIRMATRAAITQPGVTRQTAICRAGGMA